MSFVCMWKFHTFRLIYSYWCLCIICIFLPHTHWKPSICFIRSWRYNSSKACNQKEKERSDGRTKTKEKWKFSFHFYCRLNNDTHKQISRWHRRESQPNESELKWNSPRAFQQHTKAICYIYQRRAHTHEQHRTDSVWFQCFRGIFFRRRRRKLCNRKG